MLRPHSSLPPAGITEAAMRRRTLEVLRELGDVNAGGRAPHPAAAVSDGDPTVRRTATDILLALALRWQFTHAKDEVRPRAVQEPR
jgi:HEAT repeat protein